MTTLLRLKTISTERNADFFCSSVSGRYAGIGVFDENGDNGKYFELGYTTGPRWIGHTMWHSGNQGANSGLDADKLDGLHSTNFLRRDASDTYNGPDREHVCRMQLKNGRKANVSDGSQSCIEVYQATSGSDAFMTFHISNTKAGYFGLDGATGDLFWGGWSVGATKHKVYHAGNTGANSGLDADKLDGLHASQFVRSDADSWKTGFLSISSGSNQLLLHPETESQTVIHRNDGSNYYILLSDKYSTANGGWNQKRPFNMNLDTGELALGDAKSNSMKAVKLMLRHL